jgi:hypothetical protein
MTATGTLLDVHFKEMFHLRAQPSSKYLVADEIQE